MKRRLSLERLALFHVAVTSRGPEGDKARAVVTLDDVRGVEVGPTFAATLELNRGRFDLYEAAPDVRRIPQVVL
jgi:hypothetical protein